MTRHSDLLDRVAAANPVPSDTALQPGERQEADALLTRLLNAPEEPTAVPHRARPHRARRSLVLAGAVACLIVALLATSVLDRGPSFEDRAYAAVSQPSLYHVVTRTTSTVPAPLRADAVFPDHELVTESWYDLGRRAYHEAHYELRDGQRVLLREAVGGPAGTKARFFDEGAAPVQTSDAAAPDLARVDPTEQFKAAYRNDEIREDGIVTAGGHRARRLVIEHAPQPALDPQFSIRSSRTVVLVDTETLAPIEFDIELVIDTPAGPQTVVMRTSYTTFEKLPRTPANLADLTTMAP
jgi:hypothetical protein